MFAAWYGLAAGELEVVLRFVRRAFNSTDRMYLMTRHFVRLVPLVNLSLSLGFGRCAPWRRGEGRGWPDGRVPA